MSVSYSFSQRVNAQVVLWAIAHAIYSAAIAISDAYRALVALLPALLVLCKALALVAVIVGAVALVAMLPAQLWLGLAITGSLAYVGYPRTAVRK